MFSGPSFFQVADYYLVAHALSHGITIVTHEVPSDSRKRLLSISGTIYWMPNRAGVVE